MIWFHLYSCLFFFPFCFFFCSGFGFVRLLFCICSFYFFFFFSSFVYFCTFCECDSSNKSSLNSQFVVVVLCGGNAKWWQQNTRHRIVLGWFSSLCHRWAGMGFFRSVFAKDMPIFNLIHTMLYRFKSLAAKAFTLAAGDTKHILTIKRNSLCRPISFFCFLCHFCCCWYVFQTIILHTWFWSG